jgi:menaquinone-9 beta-reductase
VRSAKEIMMRTHQPDTHQPDTHQPDAIVIGGGPSGSALAIHLARSGRAVELIEQSTAPHHKVCGEFLSHEAIACLDRLGIDPRTLGAVPIHSVRLSARKQIAACDLPFPALSLTRRALDEAMLTSAIDAGATVLRGHRVNALIAGAPIVATPIVDALACAGKGWRAQLSNGESRSAPAAFLATGKHDLIGHRRPPGKQSDLIAFKMYFRLAPAQQRALEGWVELYLFPGGYAGLQLTEGGQANLCFVINQKQFRAPKGNRQPFHWPALLDHLLRHSDPLAERLSGVPTCAHALLAKPLALSFIPYGLLVADAQSGLWRLGDQAAVIPSFTGDGISIALHSAHLAAQLFASGSDSATFARRLRSELRGSVNLAATLSRLMIAAPTLAQFTRFWPGALCHLARHTRIPHSALHNHAFAR